MNKLTTTACAFMFAISASAFANANVPSQVQRNTDLMIDVMQLDETTSEKLLELNLQRYHRNQATNNRAERRQIREDFFAEVASLVTEEQLEAWESRKK